MLDKIILGLLHQRPNSAYGLQKAMEQSTAFFYGASQGNIHPTLKKLEARGAIVGQREQVGARPRVEFQLTDQGRQEFDEWVQGPLSVGRVKDDALVKLFFLGHADRQTRRQQVEAFCEELRDQGKQLREIRTQTEVKLNGRTLTDMEQYRLETLNYGISYFEFTADWYEALLERDKEFTPDTVVD